MPISPVLASYSDLAYGTALVLYLLAMVLHSIEFAAYAAARVPVTALRTTADGSVATLASPESVPARGRPERIGRSAVALTGLAALVHASSLTLRGAAIGPVRWANMYEFISAICFGAVAGWLVLLYRQRGASGLLPRLGGFSPLGVAALVCSARSSPAKSGPRPCGVVTGVGTPKRRARWSPGWFMRGICTPGQRPDGEAGGPPGSTWPVSG